MATTASSIVFDDLFTISDIDKDGKKFDRVSRLFAHSSNYDMDLTLDYNIELYPLTKGESFSLVLATSLLRPTEGGAANGADGADEEKDTYTWRPDGKGQRGIDDDYEYVMYGRVYKFDGGTSSEIVTAYMSYGGLLMTLTGSHRHMTGIVLGDPVYLLMRR